MGVWPPGVSHIDYVQQFIPARTLHPCGPLKPFHEIGGTPRRALIDLAKPSWRVVPSSMVDPPERSEFWAT